MLHFFKKATTWLWNKTIETGPYPPIRSVEVAFIRIYRKNALHKNLIGCFVPDLYLLANTSKGSLRCQMEEQAWIKTRQRRHLPSTKNHLKRLRPQIYHSLYRNDGTRKTPFELAIIPCHKLTDIESAVAKEFKNRRNHLLALPPLVSRYRLLPDYLQPDQQGNLGNSGLCVGFHNKDKPNTIRVNVWNLPHKATALEKIIHYLFYIAAILEVLCLAVGFTGASSTLMLSMAIPAIIGAILCAKVCTFYEVAEGVYRELRWLFSPDFRPSLSKLSWSNLAKSLIKFSAIALVIYGLATTQWAQILALPWTSLNLGLSSTLISAAKYGLASFLTSVGCVTSWIGLSLTMRYIWGFSIYDNHIEVTKDMAKALPIIENSKNQTNATIEKTVQLKRTAILFNRKSGKHEKETPYSHPTLRTRARLG